MLPPCHLCRESIDFDRFQILVTSNCVEVLIGHFVIDSHPIAKQSITLAIVVSDVSLDRTSLFLVLHVMDSREQFEVETVERKLH
jgi:hypothetical protein